MSDTDTGNVEERVDRLEAGQQTLTDKLDQLIGLISGRATRREDGKVLDSPGGRPPSVAEQVQQELARKEQESKAAADAEAEKSDRQTIKEQLAKLQEAPPVQPQPRSQRLMWGPR